MSDETNEESYLFEKPKRKWLSRFLNLIFILSALVIIFLIILSKMGGNSDALRGSVESFASNIFGGRPAVVEKLNRMSFFPQIGIDAENITILADPEKPLPIAHVKKVKAFMSFWNIMISSPKFSSLYVEGFAAVKGAVAPQNISVEKIFIDHDVEAKSAKIRGNGTIGEDAWSFVADLDVFGSSGGYSYMLQQPFPLSLTLGDMQLDAKIVNHEAEYFKVEDMVLTSGDKSLRGDLVLTATGNELLKVRTDLTTSQGEAIVQDVIVDFTTNPPQVFGDDTTKKMNFLDVFSDKTALYFVQRVQQIWWGDALVEAVEGE